MPTITQGPPRTFDDFLALVGSFPPVFSSGGSEWSGGGSGANRKPEHEPEPWVGESADSGGKGESSTAATSTPDARPSTRHQDSQSAREQSAAAETIYEKKICDTIQLGVLGKTGRTGVKVFSTFHRRADVIPDIARLTYEGLLLIAGAPVKSHVLKKDSDKDIPGMFSINDVREAIALLAGYRPINEDTELGLGCWDGGGPEDDEKSVILVGRNEGAEWCNGRLNRLSYPECRGMILDFESVGRGRTKGWYEFDTLADYLIRSESPEWRESVRNELVELFSRWRWQDDVASPIVMAGLVLSTWVQSLWEWRPQVSVIGPTKAGKSTLGVCLTRLYGSLCKKSSDSTEAGIRQTIMASSKIILCDEFDAEDRDKAKEQRKILKMIRSAGSGDSIMRGDAAQKGSKEFNLKHIIWLAGIQISSNKAADRNRYVNLELMPALESKRNKLVLPPASTLKDLGQKTLAVAIRCIHNAKALAVTLKDTRVPGVDDRIIESYAVPAAMLAIVQAGTSEYPLTNLDEDARGILRDMLAGITESEQTGDDERLMGDILAGHIQIGANRFSVGQLLDVVIYRKTAYTDAETALESRGLRIDTFGSGKDTPERLRGKPCFIMAYHIIAEHLLKNTSWSGQGIDQILRRLPDAVYSRRRVSGQNTYVVAISLETLKANFLGLAGDDQSGRSGDGGQDGDGGQSAGSGGNGGY